MAYYAAHIVVYFRCKDGQQPSFDIWENIVLIEADSFEQAAQKARRIGKQQESNPDPTLTFFGKPAEIVFAGVRTITHCIYQDMNSQASVRPGDGDEITFSTFSVASEDDIRKLVADEAVDVTYQSGTPDE